MIETRPDAYTADPSACDEIGGRAGANAFCRLCKQWTNCLAHGCTTRPDGGCVELDNSPGACAARLKEMEEDEWETS